MNNAEKAIVMQTKLLTIKVVEIEHGEPRETYQVVGHELPDGRIVTIGTGVDGKDSLLATIEDYQPNGLDEYKSHEYTGEVGELSVEAIAAADEDNVVYGGKSLLTEAERTGS